MSVIENAWIKPIVHSEQPLQSSVTPKLSSFSNPPRSKNTYTLDLPNPEVRTVNEGCIPAANPTRATSTFGQFRLPRIAFVTDGVRQRQKWLLLAFEGYVTFCSSNEATSVICF